MQFLSLSNTTCRMRRNFATLASRSDIHQTSRSLTRESRERIESELVEFDSYLSAIAALQLQLFEQRPEPDYALDLIAREVRNLTNADGCAVAIEADGEVTCRACAGPLAPAIGTPVYMGFGLSGQCLSSGEIISSDDAQTDPRIHDEHKPATVRSILVVPVRKDEQVVGIVAVFASRVGAFSTLEARAVEMLADVIMLYATSRASLPPPEPLPEDAVPVMTVASSEEESLPVLTDATPTRRASVPWRVGRKEVQKNLDIMRRDAALRLLGHAKNYLAIETLYDGADRSDAISLFHRLMFDRAALLGVGVDVNS